MYGRQQTCCSIRRSNEAEHKADSLQHQTSEIGLIGEDWYLLAAILLCGIGEMGYTVKYAGERLSSWAPTPHKFGQEYSAGRNKVTKFRWC